MKKKCEYCKSYFFVKEEYGKNGSDEYSEIEIGHKFECIYHEIDPINRRYVNK